MNNSGRVEHRMEILSPPMLLSQGPSIREATGQDKWLALKPKAPLSVSSLIFLHGLVPPPVALLCHTAREPL